MLELKAGSGGDTFLVRRQGGSPVGVGTSYIVRLDAAGRPVWQHEFREISRYEGDTFSVTPYADGGAVVVREMLQVLPLTETTFTAYRVRADGTVDGETLLGSCVSELPEQPECTVSVAPAPDGDLVVGQWNRALDSSTLVERGFDGAERWRVELPEAGRITAIVADPRGGFVVATSDASLVSIDADGRVRFRGGLPRPAGDAIPVRGKPLLAVDADGRIGIVSSHGPEFLEAPRVRGVHLVDAGGNLVWGSWSDAALSPSSIGFDADGRLGVAGSYRETDFLGVHHVPQGESDAFYMLFER
jgi:hypothetical protein